MTLQVHTLVRLRVRLRVLVWPDWPPQRYLPVLLSPTPGPSSSSSASNSRFSSLKSDHDVEEAKKQATAKNTARLQHGLLKSGTIGLLTDRNPVLVD